MATRNEPTVTTTDEKPSEEKKDEGKKKVKEKDLYELDPNVVDEDVIVCISGPIYLREAKENETLITLYRGDRKKGEYYVDLVKRRTEGIQLCSKLPHEFLKELNTDRLKRLKLEPEEWIKEAWANKDESVLPKKRK